MKKKELKNNESCPEETRHTFLVFFVPEEKVMPRYDNVEQLTL